MKRGILLGNKKKKGTTDTCNCMGESQMDYAKSQMQEKPDIKF